MGKLYICGTPIGNLEDVTIRLLKTLHRVDLIACEDTRHTIKLLNRYKIKKRMLSYHQHSHPQQEDYIIAQLLSGKKVALLVDAGMPGISDPGYRLISRAIAMNVKMEVVPGPTALVTALTMSGLDSDGFLFAGFLPRQKGQRRDVLSGLAQEERTLVFYEAPHRLLSTLQDILDIYGDRETVVARELTKLHEEIIRGTALTCLNHFKQTVPRGEICLLVAGYRTPPKTVDLAVVKQEVEQLIMEGVGKKEAFRRKAQEYGLKRSEVYNYYEQNKRQ